METAVKRLYEGMFLVDSALAAQDWQAILDEVQRILDRAGAEVVSLRKWDERQLCYEVNKKNRGTYILVYFNSETGKIGGIERDVQLSELITRVLVLRTDKMSTEEIEGPTPLETAAAEEAERAAAAEAKAQDAAAAAEAKAQEDAAAAEAETDTDAVVSAEAAAVETPEETDAVSTPEATDGTEEEKAS